MNIRIYFNNNFIEILSQAYTHPDKDYHYLNCMDANYEGLGGFIQKFLKQEGAKNFRVLTHSTKEAILEIKKHFVFIEAAGGLISRGNEFLFIYRHNLWDLPKGKLEKKELPDAAAIRECEEECGISGLTIKKPLQASYHIYHYKGAMTLKITHWFLMETKFFGQLKPQTEENITDVKWFNHNQIINTVYKNTYPGIKQLLSSVI